MKGLSPLVVLAAAVLVAACSDAKSLVGIEDTSGAQNLTISAESTTVPPGGSTTIRFQVTDKDGQPVKDGTVVDVTSLKLGRVESTKLWTHDGGGVATIYRAPSSPGADRIQARAGQAKATLNLTIAEPPPPAPPPADPPPPNESES